MIDACLIRAYRQFINNELMKNGSPENMCASWSQLMVEKFPELQRKRGWVYFRQDSTPNQSGTEHWWCEAKDGTIIDPSIMQYFPRFPVLYEPVGEDFEDPLGKCMNCGSWSFKSQGGNSGACSEECDQILRAYYA